MKDNYSWYENRLVAKLNECKKNSNGSIQKFAKLLIDASKEISELMRQAYNFGVCVYPCGYGKSSVVYDHTIANVMQYIGNKMLDTPIRKKLVFNISAPRLVLCAQFAENLFNALVVMNEWLKENGYKEYEFLSKSMIIPNSSTTQDYEGFTRNSKKVACIGYTWNCTKDGKLTNDKFQKKFIGDSQFDIAFVISCTKSLPNFISLDFSECIPYTYLDELHMISLNKELSDNDDIISKDKFRQLCGKSKEATGGVYGFTATPYAKIVEIINEFNPALKGTCKFFLHCTAHQAIAEGRILPIRFSYIVADTITPALVRYVFDQQKRMQPGLAYYKMMVRDERVDSSEANAKQIADDYAAVCEDTKVFISNCENGQNGYEVCNGQVIQHAYKDIAEFKDMIDSAECNCIVIHIDQLTAGVDISTLTGVMLMVNNPVKDKKTIIQQACRADRFAPGEREKKQNGLDIAKQAGLCTCVFSHDNAEDGPDELRKVIKEYWQIGDPYVECIGPKKKDSNTGKVQQPRPKKQKSKSFDKSFSTIEFSVWNLIKEHEEIFRDLLIRKGYNDTYANIQLAKEWKKCMAQDASLELRMLAQASYESSNDADLMQEVLEAIFKEIDGANESLSNAEQTAINDEVTEVVANDNGVLKGESVVKEKKPDTATNLPLLLQPYAEVLVGNKTDIKKDGDGIDIKMVYLRQDGQSYLKYNGVKYIAGTKTKDVPSINEFITSMYPGSNAYTHLLVKGEDGKMHTLFELSKSLQK